MADSQHQKVKLFSHFPDSGKDYPNDSDAPPCHPNFAL